MSRFWALLIVVALNDVLASPLQVALQAPAITEPKQLQGRFLHITDIHPDFYYLAQTSEKTACHRKKKKKSKNRAGYYGTPFSECDSPLALTNYTLDYLDKRWASEIDFVIWTGDNARHDNDPKIPRTPDEIYALNRAVAAKMRQIFLSRGIPVVPSLGNNDIWPHNILTPGPNSITNEFAKIWDIFIPFPYLQVFQRGAYHSVEVIPDEVAAISLNTLYFYDSNKAVGGCGFHDRNDPGNLEFDWLEVQLKMYRHRNMQVWITGHVPPSPGNYFPDCYVRYVELSLRFQDTILGHLFGHMNMDHFSFLESIDLEFVDNQDDGPEQQRKTPLYDTLMEEFAALPKKSEEIDYSDYAVVNTAPPVVPNPYLPSFRIFVYNVTGRLGYKANKRKHGHKRGGLADKTARCRLKENRDTWKCFLNGTWNSDPGSPSRSNKQWTPLGYAQYYLPDLEKADKKREPEYKLEYVTFAPSQLHPAGTDDEGSAFRYPIPLKRLPKSLQNSSVTESKFAPYSMADLTIPSWVELAQRLGNEKQEALRAEFRKYMYMGGEEG
ncbi:Endopolyphosphatase [Termitomyces sp. T112]|nr:Endopolyphosphatase [Termitomyces sp. T112]